MLKKICVQYKFSTKYEFEKQLGKGCFARVHLARNKSNGTKVAIKTIEKSKILKHPNFIESAMFEIDALRVINHPNVIKIYEVFENELYVHLVIEYLDGGELFTQLKSKGIYSEKDASMAIQGILSAVAHFHALGIIHRDLKPENLIAKYFYEYFIRYKRTPDTKYDLRIVDFGLSTFCDPTILQTVKCGSPGYIAPEILKDEGYNNKADVFSVGIILATMYFIKILKINID